MVSERAGEPLENQVLRAAWDPIRLWELAAEHPEVSVEDLRPLVIRLIRMGLLTLVPTESTGCGLALDRVVAYIGDDQQWLNLVENPWPHRGVINELLLTDSGRRRVS